KAFGLDDPMLQTACAYHTTGAPDMNTLDKIVMLGDLIEPSRTFDGVEALREIAHQDLDSAVLMSLDYTISYLIRRQRIIDPRPVFLRNQLIGAGVHYPSE
ncbi:MAG: HD domain-containing protein, partial [Chloroflexi bacterium]|nr:HD domain-containing protein [Chloroflexota bacterium]